MSSVVDMSSSVDLDARAVYLVDPMGPGGPRPLADSAPTSFVVRCKECQRVILTEPRIGDAEARILTDHLRRCAAPLWSAAPTLAEILSHFAVDRATSGS